MNNTLCSIVFLPLIVGLVILFLPDAMKILSKTVTLVISILTCILAIRIFRGEELAHTWSILRMDGLSLDLLLTTTSLNKFILLFAMGFGLLITLYSLKSAAGAKNGINPVIFKKFHEKGCPLAVGTRKVPLLFKNHPGYFHLKAQIPQSLKPSLKSTFIKWRRRRRNTHHPPRPKRRRFNNRRSHKKKLTQSPQICKDF